jgi:alpha-ketoglutarate-dependent taurine dioxygenase
MAWRGADLARRGDWIDALTPDELTGLGEAASRLGEDPDGWIGTRPEDLPLGPLAARIARMADELENGRGFLLIRGLDATMALPEVKKRYWALGVHFGRIVPQNMKGELLGSVTDKGSRYLEDVNARGYTSNDEMFFHSDAGDAVSLLCVRQARTGGENAIVSTMTIYNALLEEAPHLLPVLARGFPVYVRDDAKGARVGGITAGEVSGRRFPVFSAYKGRLSGGINLKSVRAVPQVTGVPFTSEETEALDAFEAIATRDGMALSLRTQPGDILIVNNYMVLHKRTRFNDYDAPERKRLLLRFWINLHNGRELSPDVEAALRSGFDATPVMEAA